jgi:hypothetical protein
MDIKFIYIHLFSVTLFVFRSAQWLFEYTPSIGHIFTRYNVSDKH